MVEIVDINLEYITYDEFKKMKEKEIIKRILSSKNKVIIVDRKLTPQEEVKLIEKAMAYAAIGDFKGIEITSISKDSKKGLSKFLSFIKKGQKGITLIGNASLIRKIKHSKKGTIIRL